MNLSKRFISTLAAVAVAGTIGVASAQSTSQAPADSAQRSGDTNTNMRNNPSRDSTGNMNSDSNMRNNTYNNPTRDSTGALNSDNRTGASGDATMRSERVAKGDRN